MILYTCGAKRLGGRMPIWSHPCAAAAAALEDAGHAFELRTVGGYRSLPWTRRGQRDHIRELSGQEDVPVLVLADEGETVIAGTARIVAWAREHPAR